MTKPILLANEQPEVFLSSTCLAKLPQQMRVSALLAIHQLRDAYDAAFECGHNAWEFSIELPQMQKVGVESHVLRVLICKGWVIHQKESNEPKECRRTFEPTGDLVLSDLSSFVITKEGYEVAKSTDHLKQQIKEATEPDLVRGNPLSREDQCRENSTSASQAAAPVWDRERRELRLGEIVVKRFKWPAENQELVLDAFEDNGWPERIGNPLVTIPHICPKRRLHDTLKCLNRKQLNEFIKFRGDGTGLGVLLEIRQPGQSVCANAGT